MQPLVPAFLSSLWPVIWPILALAVLLILLRFIFKLAMRVVVSGCVVLLLVGAAVLLFRFLR